jgi:hypothetical protein
MIGETTGENAVPSDINSREKIAAARALVGNAAGKAVWPN